MSRPAIESENGVIMENESCVMEENYVEEVVVLDTSEADRSKKIDNIGEATEAKEMPELGTEEGDLQVARNVSPAVAANKNSTPAKGSATQKNGTKKKDKEVKEKTKVKGSAASLLNEGRVFSQSLSFPARGAHANITKSIDGYPTRINIKHAQESGRKPEFPSSTGSVKSAPRLKANKQAPAGVKGKEGKRIYSRASVQQNPGPSVPSIQPGKSNSENAASIDHSPEESQSVNQNLDAMNSALRIKEDDDARSSNSSTPGGRRGSTSAFSFRLEERAERRKEFFLKIEEKIQAKEAEKNNLQAKSKESQEAEIRRMRKCMTFKAKPMPTFYKEPPPKIELKKVPTTRPISPKLGRHKCHVAATNSSVDGSPRSCRSPRLGKEVNISAQAIQPKPDKGSASSKKPIKNSQPRMHSHEMAAPANEGMTIKSKPEASGQESQNQELCPTETKENHNQSPSPSENLVNQESEKNSSEVIRISSTAIPRVVSVEG